MLEICLEYLDALCHVGIALLIILQAKVLILGNNSLFCHTLFSNFNAAASGGTGLENLHQKGPADRFCKQILY
jgi:hypothetical protein